MISWIGVGSQAAIVLGSADTLAINGSLQVTAALSTRAHTLPLPCSLFTLWHAGSATIGSSSADVLTIRSALSGASPLVFEGATKNACQTTLAVADPTASRRVLLPDSDGTVILQDSAGNAALPGDHECRGLRLV